MTFRTLCLAAALGALPLVPLPASAATAPVAAKPDTAIFAGGCFWCMEAQFETAPGVKSVTAGYTGGHTPHPTYEQVGSHTTGHVEAVRIVFDPSATSYTALLQRFWYGIDPTQADGQFCDEGDTYRTAIFYRNEAQHRAALDSRQAIERAGLLKASIVTAIRPASVFWPAEDYHQDFWKKQPERYRAYREGCGRDDRLARLWGAVSAKLFGH